MSPRLSKVLVAAVVAAVVLALLLRRRLNDRQLASMEANLEDSGAAPVASSSLETASRDELYQEAKRLGVRGRSRMTKDQLRATLSERGRE